MCEYINAENLNIVTNILVIAASSCAIWGFYKWNRTSVLDRKIALYEDFYSRFLDLYSTINYLYSPDKLYAMRVSDIDLNNDNQLKERIQNYRQEIIARNRKLYFEIKGFETRLQIYFKSINKPLNIFSKLWMDIDFSTSESYERCPEQLMDMLTLDEDFLRLFRKDNIIEEEYTNTVLTKFNDLKNKFELILMDMLR